MDELPLPQDFLIAIEYVLKNEGGYTNRSQDLGGPTNYGITMELLAKYRQRQVSTDEVMELTTDEAKQIYYRFFWHPILLDSLPLKMATAILDMSVNQGQYSAIRLAQMAVGIAPNDGVMGPHTIQVLQDYDPIKFLDLYVGVIQDKYCDIIIGIPSQILFLKGWLRRSRRMLTI